MMGTGGVVGMGRFDCSAMMSLRWARRCAEPKASPPLAPRRLEVIPREADDTDADLLLELGDLARLGELLQRLVDRV